MLFLCQHVFINLTWMSPSLAHFLFWYLSMIARGHKGHNVLQTTILKCQLLKKEIINVNMTILWVKVWNVWRSACSSKQGGACRGKDRSADWGQVLAPPRCCFGLGAVEPKMAISTVVDLVDHFKVLHIFGKSSVGLQLPLDYHCDCDKIMGRCQEDN